MDLETKYIWALQGLQSLLQARRMGAETSRGECTGAFAWHVSMRPNLFGFVGRIRGTRKSKYIWMNARESAVKFYLNLGYINSNKTL